MVSFILILNSIKDINNSILVSLDLNKELFEDPNKLTGYRINQYFPELKKIGNYIQVTAT